MHLFHDQKGDSNKLEKQPRRYKFWTTDDIAAEMRSWLYLIKNEIDDRCITFEIFLLMWQCDFRKRVLGRNISPILVQPVAL